LLPRLKKGFSKAERGRVKPLRYRKKKGFMNILEGIARWERKEQGGGNG